MKMPSQFFSIDVLKSSHSKLKFEKLNQLCRKNLVKMASEFILLYSRIPYYCVNRSLLQVDFLSKKYRKNFGKNIIIKFIIRKKSEMQYSIILR